MRNLKSKSISRQHPQPVSTSAAAPRQTVARSGSKQATVVDLLGAPGGTTLAALAAATGWQRHSIRSFLSAVVRKKLKLNLTSDAGDDGRVYRIARQKGGVLKSGKRNSAKAA